MSFERKITLNKLLHEECDKSYEQGRKVGLEEAVKSLKEVTKQLSKEMNSYGAYTSREIEEMEDRSKIYCKAIRNLAKQAKDEKGEG